MHESVFFIFLARYDPFVKNSHRRHYSCTQPARNRSFCLLVCGEHLHLRTISIEICLKQLSLQTVRSCRKTRTSTHQLNVWNQFFPLVRVTFLQTLTDQLMYTLESIFILFVEVNFRSHKQLFPEDHLILVRQLVSSLISKLVVTDALVSTVQQVTVLMLHFPHYLLNR